MFMDNWCAVLLCEVEDEPGIWTARLCRSLNGVPETEIGIRFCGRCTDYANMRKRARAVRHAEMPTLPGLAPAYQLHAPCLTLHFKAVMRYLARLAWATMIHGVQEEIPDPCQPRGWDFGTRWYPLD